MSGIIIIILLVLFAYLVVTVLPIILIIAAISGSIYGLYRLIRYVRKELYFSSDEFLEHRRALVGLVKDYNEISNYVRTIPRTNYFVADNSRYDNSHLAKFENTSIHNYKRDRYQRILHDAFVYPASLNIVRRASQEPIKYLCKYFGIDANEKTLDQLEQIGENISRMENTIENLHLREEQIKSEFNPPKFILKHYENELYKKLALDIPDVQLEYATYVFEYVSPGGNSSQRTPIEFNGETVEAVQRYISGKIQKQKNAKYQRSLMTNRLRTEIKERDNYTCQICGVSIYDQNLLLLEVDHIIPISKGGLSKPENLQTLCWKCNRHKSDKLPMESNIISVARVN